MWTLFCTPHYSSPPPCFALLNPFLALPLPQSTLPLPFPLLLLSSSCPSYICRCRSVFMSFDMAEKRKFLLACRFHNAPSRCCCTVPFPFPLSTRRSVPMSPMDDDGCQASAIRCYYVYSMHTERVVSVTIAHSDCNCNCRLHWRFLASVELISICRVASLFIILAQLL